MWVKRKDGVVVVVVVAEHRLGGAPARLLHLLVHAGAPPVINSVFATAGLSSSPATAAVSL